MNSLNFLPSSSMPPPFALFLFGLDHALVGGADTVHHPLLIAELLDEAVALGDETFDAGFSIGRDLLFDGLGEALHRAARAVVELDEHFAHPLKRLLHALARAGRALLPSLNSLIGLLDGREDRARVDFEDDGFLVHDGLGSSDWN